MRRILQLSILFALFFTVLVGPARINQMKSTVEFESPSKELSPKRIAIIGDIQRTLTVERIIGREQNDDEREKILEDLISSNPDLILMLGDFVATCHDKSGWEYFDKITAKIKEKNIPTLGILGNHEYLGIGCAKMQDVYKRFPHLKEAMWFDKVYQDVGMIFLNSNHASLNSKDWNEEIKWYENKIKEYEANPRIRGFLVFSHHPPYSNGIIVRSDIKLRKDFAPLFIQSKKGMAFISGHVHGYERIEVNGKIFLISAGGGGPRQRLYGEDNKRYYDHYKGDSPRPFNYVTLSPEMKGLQFHTRGLEKKGTSVFNMDSFFISFQ